MIASVAAGGGGDQHAHIREAARVRGFDIEFRSRPAADTLFATATPRALVGVNKLRLPEPALALAATGDEPGTIVPIGSNTDWPIYAGESTPEQT